MAHPSALQPNGDCIESGKKRLDEFKKDFTLGGQRKRTPMKQDHAKMLFQLRNLPAHRWLLDAIRNVPHCFHDPAVTGDVIEQLQVMNVHDIVLNDAWKSFNDSRTGGKLDRVVRQ